ncbi:hypothetical protein KKH59_00545 [Patescibacteria group bacterium]|nr:hypothetical protein [Patescibacteria group bacterium]
MPKSPTQEFLEIADIRDDVLILKNKTLRGVLVVSSLNFVLKSEEEQTAVLHQFQNFLNSLDFSCQIIIQSRRLNITGYIEKLKDLEDKQKNELLKVQTKSYYEFIQSLIAAGTIMTKNFYLVVPFYPIELQGISPGEEMFKRAKSILLSEKELQRCKSQLLQRMEFLILSLRRCGLNAFPLTTEELIELFWSFYHPQEAEMGYYPGIPPELLKKQVFISSRNKEHGIVNF